MKILAITPYPLEGPSSRYRVYNFEGPLRKEGIALDIRPFMTRAMYFRWMHRRVLDPPMLARLLGRALRRVADLLGARGHDAVWIHRQCAPALHRVFDGVAVRAGPKLIFDMDDAVFTEYSIDGLLRHCDAATVGNSYLAAYVRCVSARTEAVVVPTVVDPLVYRPVAHPAPARPVVGWIGTGASFRHYLLPVLPGIAETCRENGADLLVIASPDVRPAVEEAGGRFAAWGLDSYIGALRGVDIGLMPLLDDAYVRGKCAFKLIEYGALGIPSVATDLGANRDVVVDGVTGFLAASDEQFRARLAQLIRDPGLRASLGGRARARVLDHYSLEAQAQAVAGLMRRVVGG
ncbi:glycosyltransferase family 4 protein [Deinococcus aestuarii]|uniref:glycosyltransferase family 4 protein n=1 Tax=Deinococcus aestuarii TaxID=2774531 RepID=UPI001C0ADDBA|nr:glycosyltransferase family 4 protein [Deinococcus aestuarii]